MSKEYEDIVIEDDPESISAEGSMKKLREKLKKAEAKAKEHLDSWQRAQAEFMNIRKRDDEAKVEFLKLANAGLVSDLLPVLDSFEQALSHGHDEVKPVRDQLLQILQRHGLTETDPVGSDFDPREHEAIGSMPTKKESEDGQVLEVVQKGYILSGKILRPAKVRVGQLTN